MIGNQSFKCIVKENFRYNGTEYKIGDQFTVRTYSPIEKGYLSIGFVEKCPVSDYSFFAVNIVNIDDQIFSKGKEIPLECVLKIDIDMYVRLGYVNQILKSDLETPEEEQSDKILLPKGTMACKAHKAINMPYTEFMALLKSLGHTQIAINKPLSDEIVDQVNKILSLK